MTFEDERGFPFRAEMEEASQKRYVSPYDLAAVYSGVPKFYQHTHQHNAKE